MKQSSLFYRGLSLLLSAGLLLSLAACGGDGGGGKGKDTAAATMHLRRAEGEVSVSDDGGDDVSLRENLGLYSGYGVRTRSESYAWIDLDNVKLTKLDQDSRIAIEQEGKELEIEVKSGSLFFNVTEPLKDDETMNIRTSTMLVGIRGTCGWVEDRGNSSRVYLLEGKVTCSANGGSEQVRAGEMAEAAEDGEITVTAFTAWDIPAFVLKELEEEGLIADVLNATGWDPLDMIYAQDSLNAPSGSLARVPVAEYRIEHEDSEVSYKYMLDSYFEYPVFDSTEPGYRAINSFFLDLRNEFFFGDRMEQIVQAVEPLTPSDTPYDYHYDAEVTARGEQYVSVQLRGTFWDGNTTPSAYGTGYVFSTATGKRLNIRDFIDASDEEILDMIRSGFEAELNRIYQEMLGDSFGMEVWVQTRNGTIEDFNRRSPDVLNSNDFYVRDGAVHLYITDYADMPGIIEFSLPALLKLN